jgi:hypothetical protein
MTELSKQIDYKLKGDSATIPTYKYLRVPLNNLTSSSTITITNASQLLEFKLPSNKVYNLSRSCIAYNLHADAVASTYIWSPEDVFSLAESISFGTAGNENIVDLKYVDKYTKTATKLGTDLSDYLSADSYSQLYPSNSGASSSATVMGLQSAVSYTEPKYVAINSTGVTGAAYDKYVSYPLGNIKNTLLAVDKDVYFGNEMYVRMQTAPADRMVWTGTSSANPNTGAAASTSAISLRNMYLFLAVEQTELINSSIIAKFDSGNFHINCPYTVAVNNTTASTVANINVQITKQYGKRLMQIMHVVANSAQTLNTAYDLSNVAGDKILTYRSSLDSTYQQDYALSCAAAAAGVMNNDDWFIANRKFCKNTPILNRAVYQQNWFHVDRWYEGDSIEGAIENQDVGIPLTNNTMNWILETTAAATTSRLHYTYLTFRRGYTITKDGVFPDVN